jgi:hypothetical protein
MIYRLINIVSLISHTQPHVLLVIEVKTNFENLFHMAAIFFPTLLAFQVYITTHYFRLLNQVALESSGLGRYNKRDVSINVFPTGMGI